MVPSNPDDGPVDDDETFDDPDGYDPPDDIVDDAELFRDLQREFHDLKPGRFLSPELDEIYQEIRFVMNMRAIGRTVPPVPFERFEASDVIMGGMGIVLKARDPKLDRWVAIKLWQQAGQSAHDALVAEARTLARLTHPNVVRVYDAGVWNGHAYFVMEWIDGLDGAALIEQVTSWDYLLEIFIAAGHGLAATHDVGIHHRDFKPSNILVGDDHRVVVADFGVADWLRTADDDERGSMAGTPAYMAPERLRGGRGDARSDQFSFCVALWRALYRVRPFSGETPEALLASMKSGKLAADRVAEVPLWLGKVVVRGLALDPDARYPDMYALVDALTAEPDGGSTWVDEAYGRPNPSDENDPILHSPRGGRASRARRLATLGGVVALVGVAVMSGMAYERRSTVSLMVNVEAPRSETSAMVEQPCVLDGVDVELDPVLIEVCSLVRIDKLEAASMLWEREYRERVVAATGQQHTHAEECLVVSSTFIGRALELQAIDPVKAEMAAGTGHMWASTAAIVLTNDDPRVMALIDQAVIIGINP